MTNSIQNEVVFIHQQSIIATSVENNIKAGLSAQDIMSGVHLSHEDYLHLFELARDGLGFMLSQLESEQRT
jgi:hypothetical protein